MTTIIVFLVLFISQKSLSKTHPEDVIGLKSLKSAIQPSSIHAGSCVSSWNFAHDPCSPSSTSSFVCGFTCDESNSRVIRLELEPSGYAGTIPQLISRMSALQVLDFSDNSFTGNVPQEIGKLASLQSLLLSGNKLSGPIPSELRFLSDLRLLDLSRNEFHGNLPQGLFSNMKNLQRLYLQQNSFTGTIPASISNAKTLRYLDASSNKLSGSLTNLPESLLQISLRSNKFTGPIEVHHFHQVLVLDLSSNEFTGTLSSSLFELRNLQQCNVSSNKFTSISSDGKFGASELVAFDASHNKLTGNLPQWLPKLSRLSALYLSDNLFTGTIPSEYIFKSDMNGARTVLPLARLFLDGNYLRGDVSDLLKKPMPNLIAASFVNNCLTSCSPALSVCKGGQRPKSQCQAFKHS